MLLSFWTSKRLLIGFIIPYCYLKPVMVWPASKETGSGHTLVVVHSPVQLTAVSWEDICYKWCASEDHFRPLIIFILHKWLAQLFASLSSENVHQRYHHYLCWHWRQQFLQFLQKVQNCAAHIITTSNYDASLDELFQSLNWHKLELLRKFNLSILLY